MEGNAAFSYRNTAVLSVSSVLGPIVMTSDAFDERLAPAYERLALRPGLLQGLAGIEERRWWPEDVTFADAAAQAGEKAIRESGIDRQRIGLLIDTSVCRDHLEPSAAVAVHHKLGLTSACLNFDLANACLGFVNGMHLAATMIDAGQIDYALVVDGEGSRKVQETTMARMNEPTATVEQFFAEFASLTLGSGSAAMVLGRADRHPEGHRMICGVTRAASQHHELCVGTLDGMRTDTKGLLDAGLEVAELAWKEANHDWALLDYYVIHQISSVHTGLVCDRLGIDPGRAPRTFPKYGNIGPASVPVTLASQLDKLVPGDRIACLGMGSGINAAVTELLW